MLWVKLRYLIRRRYWFGRHVWELTARQDAVLGQYGSQAAATRERDRHRASPCVVSFQLGRSPQQRDHNG